MVGRQLHPLPVQPLAVFDGPGRKRTPRLPTMHETGGPGLRRRGERLVQPAGLHEREFRRRGRVQLASEPRQQRGLHLVDLLLYRIHPLPPRCCGAEHRCDGALDALPAAADRGVGYLGYVYAPLPAERLHRILPYRVVDCRLPLRLCGHPYIRDYILDTSHAQPQGAVGHSVAYGGHAQRSGRDGG